METVRVYNDEVSESPIQYDVRKIEKIVDAFSAKFGWKKGRQLNLKDGLRWVPALVSDGDNLVIHFHFSSVIRRHITERLKAAFATGYGIHIGLPLEALYDSEVLQVLGEIDASVHIVSEDGATDSGKHYLDALTSMRIPVSPIMRGVLARAAYERLRAGTNHQKGRKLESLLSFLLEQVADFHVVERNFRGDSDEIDLIIQIENWSNRCWQLNGVPFVLVEAKNRTETTGQPTVSLLIRRLQTKRGTARIGVIFSMSDFSRDADLEVVKLAESDLSIVLIGPDQFMSWIESVGPDDYLEGEVRRAMLR